MAITNVGKSSVSVSQVGTSNTSAMAMVTTLFFMWGFITCLNDILIPHLKAIFDLNYGEVMLVQLVFFSCYAVFAFPAGKIIEWIGYKWTMVTGLTMMAIGSLLFLPAASVPAFILFLAALIVVAAGMTALQVSANPYVSVLGPPETASSRLNLTQAFNSLGTTVAPHFGGRLILSAEPESPVQHMAPAALQAYRLEQASSVKLPYVLIAIALLTLAFVIAIFKLPSITTGVDLTAEEDPNTRNAISLWPKFHFGEAVCQMSLPKSPRYLA
jgi:MFS transporter, FHS family, L-fucose permease